MNRFLLALLFLLAFDFSLFSQGSAPASDKGSYKKNFTEGNINLLDFEYVEALKYFQYAFKYDSTNANINYKIGQCYLHHPTQKHLAEKYLEKAVEDVSKKYIDDDGSEKQASIMAYFFLGQAYHLDGRLDEAIKMYDTYESYLSPKKKLDREDIEYVDHFKKQVQNARQMMLAPLNIKITNLGDSINNEYPEYSPVMTADEQILYYTTRRPTTTGGEKSLDDGMYYEDIVVSYKDVNGKWSKPVSISPYVNTSSHEATVSLTPDGQTLIVYRGDVGSGDLYYSTFDGKDWSIPQRFGSNINTEFRETHACMSRDGNTLYFVSERPGGLGDGTRDIYKCVKLPNGQWSLAQNIGPPINTPYDEDAPFLGADGVTFYFASSGDKSMGGFDIMFSIIDENGKFSEPMNMGYPINTTDDDAFYVASPDNKRFYLSSAHEEIGKGSVHEKGFGEKDLYMGTVDIVRENPLVLFRGRFVPGPCDSLPEDIVVMVTSISSGEIVGTYRPNRRTGTFSVIIPPGSKYNFTYQQAGVDLSSEEVFVPNDIAYEEIQKAINLRPVKICPGMIVKEDTVAKLISLNVLVLNNKKDKKPIGKAEIKLHHKNAADFTTQSDESGMAKAIKLDAEKSYELIASLNGKNSSPVIFNTLGITENKVIEKIVYLEKSAEEDLSLLLDVVVLNSKTLRKPVVGTKVKIKGTDGSTQELVTDEKGKISGIALAASTNYEIDVEKDGNIVSRGLVSTQGIRKSKKIEKVLYITGAVSEVPDNSLFSGDCFSFFFRYNVNEVDESAPEYKQFIDKLMEIKKTTGKISVTLQASASTVPTSKFKNNEDLAKLRGNTTITKLKAYLMQRGVAESDIVIASFKTFVSGPAYQGDPGNTERYGKFQYVKFCINK